MEKICQIVACGEWATADELLEEGSACANVFNDSVEPNCQGDKYAIEIYFDSIRDSCP